MAAERATPSFPLTRLRPGLGCASPGLRCPLPAGARDHHATSLVSFSLSRERERAGVRVDGGRVRRATVPPHPTTAGARLRLTGPSLLSPRRGEG